MTARPLSQSHGSATNGACALHGTEFFSRASGLRSISRITVEQSLIELAGRFNVKKVLFDPYQMQATAQRLAREGLEH